MKKLIYSLLALIPALFCACNEDPGTEPGTDPEPRVTIYSYAPEDEELNPDNDVAIRLATNSATKEVAYLVEKTEDVDAFLAPYKEKNQLAEGEAAYAQKVLAEGHKVTVDGAQTVDFTIKDLHGPNTISAVAAGSNHRNYVEFTGLDWTKVVSGTFMFRQSFMPQSKACDLEVCTTDSKIYRLKNVFGEGFSMKVNMTGTTAQASDGTIGLFRIAPQNTGLQIGLKDGKFPMWVEDVGYWQGDASFVTDVSSSYINYMYEDGYMVLNIVWCANKSGSITPFSFSANNYSVFIPDQTPAN